LRQEPDQPLRLLVSGAPGIGKTTFAVEARFEAALAAVMIIVIFEVLPSL
jgi:nucleoside-triphosphatase THEP1